jgi:hypothetical protein
MPLFLIPILSSIRSFLGTLFNFFTTKPGIYVGLVLIVLGTGWWWGHHEYARGKADQISAEIAAGKKIANKQAQIVHDLQTKYLPAETKIVTVTKTIIQKVPEYVTEKDDAACTINRGFVRMHDAAAEDTVPSGPTGADAADSGVKPSVILSTVVQNYGICHLAFSRLSEWQEWYLKNKSLWEKKD